jgi:hypothetical protein
MNALAPLGELLAAPGSWRQMSSGFQGRKAQVDVADLIWLGVAVVVLLVFLWWLTRLAARRDKTRMFTDDKSLFRALCRAHGLDRSSCRLLKRLAQWQRLSHPARLFLEPDRFHTTNIGPELRRQQASLEAVRDKIFGATLKDLVKFR